jgi:hypothetical protein
LWLQDTQKENQGQKESQEEEKEIKIPSFTRILQRRRRRFIAYAAFARTRGSRLFIKSLTVTIYRHLQSRPAASNEAQRVSRAEINGKSRICNLFSTRSV